MSFTIPEDGRKAEDLGPKSSSAVGRRFAGGGPRLGFATKAFHSSSVQPAGGPLGERPVASLFNARIAFLPSSPLRKSRV